MVYIELSGGTVLNDADVDKLVTAISRKLVGGAPPAAGIRITAVPTSSVDDGTYRKLKESREAQRKTAYDTRDLVAHARANGMSWAAIADALHMEHSTLIRQYRSGGPIVAVRPRPSKKELA